eukprot:739547-Heterocapsa_arctica.AAC.1
MPPVSAGQEGLAATLRQHGSVDPVAELARPVAAVPTAAAMPAHAGPSGSSDDPQLPNGNSVEVGLAIYS